MLHAVRSPHLNERNAPSTQRIAVVPHARDAAHVAATPERRTALRNPRAWWLAQARWWLAQARVWRERFGADDHDAALGWYLHALLEADRYRRWAHELAPALRQVDALLAEAS